MSEYYLGVKAERIRKRMKALVRSSKDLTKREVVFRLNQMATELEGVLDSYNEKIDSDNYHEYFEGDRIIQESTGGKLDRQEAIGLLQFYLSITGGEVVDRPKTMRDYFATNLTKLFNSDRKSGFIWKSGIKIDAVSRVLEERGGAYLLSLDFDENTSGWRCDRKKVSRALYKHLKAEDIANCSRNKLIAIRDRCMSEYHIT